MRHGIVIALFLASGCVSMSEPIKLQQRQGELIARLADEQRRANPPRDPAEAERISTIYNVATQSVRLSRVNLKKVGPAKAPVPNPADLAAVEDFTDRYETAVDEENLLKGILKNFAAKRFGIGDAATGGGALGLVSLLVGMWKKKKKADLVARQYDDGIQAQDPEERRKITLGPEAQLEHERIDAARKARAVT